MPGHPQDHDLPALRRIERTLEAQRRTAHGGASATGPAAPDPAERSAAHRGPTSIDGKAIDGWQRTLDPEVVRCYLHADGVRHSLLYVNTRQHTCMAVGRLFALPALV